MTQGNLENRTQLSLGVAKVQLTYSTNISVMKRKAVVSLVFVSFVILLSSCGKKTETFYSPSIDDYSSLQVGKVYIYRLDSTILASFGTSLIVKSYHAKDSIESTFNDNQGRPSYRIFRYIRDTTGVQAWRFAATYVATAANQSLEYVDNNMRFIKLRLPITEGYTWKAHTFIDTKSINTTVPYLDEWEYEYRNVGQPFSVLNKTYDSTVTVAQHDETTPEGPFNPNSYQQRNYGQEVYAKGVGLIYKEFLHWTWQTSPKQAYEDGSYGIKLRLISHK